ncbi:MAG: hypothetical protein SangKO_010850 [Sandaracinaceae bacterium]
MSCAAPSERRWADGGRARHRPGGEAARRARRRCQRGVLRDRRSDAPLRRGRAHGGRRSKGCSTRRETRARAERDAELEALDQRLAARIAELEAEAEDHLQRARSERGTAAKERDKAILRYREARERLLASLPELA